MSEENLTNVDDPAQAVEPEPQPVAAVEPDEADAVEVNGTPLVPLSAVKALRTELKAVKERAGQADTLAAQLAQLQGQVAGYRQVQEQLRQPAPAPTDAKPDAKALRFAQRLDLYRQDEAGRAVPDVEKAQELLGIIEEVAQQKATEQVQPIRQQSDQERSASNFRWATQNQPPAVQQLITQIWRTFPAEYTSNPQIAQTLVYTALGMAAAQQPNQPAAPKGQPVFTESVGGNPRTRPVMSEMERRIAADKGLDEKKWGDLTKDFVKGRTNVLEE